MRISDGSSDVCSSDLFLDYVHDIDVSPVPPSPKLDAARGRLPGRKLIFTNGSVRHAENVLNRLGVAHHFEAIYDIVAAGYRPKPDPASYDTILALHGVDPHRAVLVEDMPRNLEPAHALGLRSEEHTSELQSLMRISYAVFCLKKK